MNRILYIYFAVIAASSSVASSWNLLDLGPESRSRPDSLELERILSTLKRARANAISMDYLGGSVERRHPSQRASEETSDSEQQASPLTPRTPVVVYLEKKYPKRVRVEQGSSSSESREVSYADVLQFLVQADARLKEQEERKHKFSRETDNILDLLRSLRRVNEIEEDKTEELPEKSEPKAPKTFSSREVPKKQRIYSEEYKPRKSKKFSIEREYRPRNKRKGSGYKFLRTPKPFLGKRGIYEE